METSNTPNRPSTQGLETLSAAALSVPEEHTTQLEIGLYAEGDMGDLRSFHISTDARAGTPSAMQTTQLPSSSNLDHIPNPPSMLSPAIDPNLKAFESTHGIYAHRRSGYGGAAHMKASTETDGKVAFLLRHFSETTGR
ncbi:MAG: hypothetical protein Q9183_007928, partial [Haloplaca sp. 2 TL-2023]